MLAIKNREHIYVCLDPVDFRNGIDGLVRICSYDLGHEPRDGSFFLFCNRRKTSIKILFYNDGGYWLAMKRFSRGRLKYWPKIERINHRTLKFLLKAPD